MPHTPVSSASSTSSWSEPGAPLLDVLTPGPAARAALAAIRAYKYLLSPWLTGACRYLPTCADYTAEAIARHGFVRGSWLGLRRLSRCHPFGRHGHDPVPLASSGALTNPKRPTHPVH